MVFACLSDGSSGRTLVSGDAFVAAQRRHTTHATGKDEGGLERTDDDAEREPRADCLRPGEILFVYVLAFRVLSNNLGSDACD